MTSEIRWETWYWSVYTGNILYHFCSSYTILISWYGDRMTITTRHCHPILRTMDPLSSIITKQRLRVTIIIAKWPIVIAITQHFPPPRDPIYPELEQILTHNVYVNLNSSRWANKRTELTIYSPIWGTCNFTSPRPGVSGSGGGRARAAADGAQSVTESCERNMSERRSRRSIKYNQFPINPP